MQFFFTNFAEIWHRATTLTERYKMKVAELIKIHKDKRKFSFKVLPPSKGSGTGNFYTTYHSAQDLPL